MRFSAAVAGCPLPARFLRRCGFAGILLASPLCANSRSPSRCSRSSAHRTHHELTAAPAGSLFAWVENTEGRNNLWVGGRVPLPANSPTTPKTTGRTSTTSPGRPTHPPSPTATGPSGPTANPPTPRTYNTPRRSPSSCSRSHPTPRPSSSAKATLLYTHSDGSSLLYLHDGQIWIAELSQRKQCMFPEGCPTAPANPATPTHQLVFDRGTASQLTSARRQHARLHQPPPRKQPAHPHLSRALQPRHAHADVPVAFHRQ